MLTEEQIRELKAKHGPKLTHFPTELGDVVFRAPSRPEFERFVDESQRESGKAAAMVTLTRACVVHPAGAEFERIIDAQPGYVPKFTAAINRLGGAKAEIEGKEL